MKILVLTCSTGGGHNACANYIKEEFLASNVLCDVKNYMDIVGKHASFIAEKMYLDSTRGKGHVFKNIYRLGEVYSSTNIPSPVYGFNKLVRDKLYKYITDNNYDLVICTHLFPSLALTAIKKKHDIKLVNVATDYECIPFWEETTPDLFVIPSIYLQNRFINKGFNKDVLLPIGIPVASRFKNTLGNLDLPKDKDIVMLVSGSMGFGTIEKLVKSLLDANLDCYFLIICGNNATLKAKLESLNNPNLIIKGFVNNINEYMISSTIVVTKPGGLTTTEVATLGRPLIHMMPIPGVENYNANFFEEYGMAIKALSDSDVVTAIKKLLADKDLQKQMVFQQQKIINRNSAQDLVQYIMKGI